MFGVGRWQEKMLEFETEPRKRLRKGKGSVPSITGVYDFQFPKPWRLLAYSAFPSVIWRFFSVVLKLLKFPTFMMLFCS